jgi:hypothetical protein
MDGSAEQITRRASNGTRLPGASDLVEVSSTAGVVTAAPEGETATETLSGFSLELHAMDAWLAEHDLRLRIPDEEPGRALQRLQRALQRLERTTVDAGCQSALADESTQP